MARAAGWSIFPLLILRALLCRRGKYFIAGSRCSGGSRNSSRGSIGKRKRWIGSSEKRVDRVAASDTAPRMWIVYFPLTETMMMGAPARGNAAPDAIEPKTKLVSGGAATRAQNAAIRVSSLHPAVCQHAHRRPQDFQLSTFNFQRHLVSRSTPRVFGAEAANQWRDAVAAPGSLNWARIPFARHKSI